MNRQQLLCEKRSTKSAKRVRRLKIRTRREPTKMLQGKRLHQYLTNHGLVETVRQRKARLRTERESQQAFLDQFTAPGVTGGDIVVPAETSTDD